jgi:hypothetical protein
MPKHVPYGLIALTEFWQEFGFLPIAHMWFKEEETRLLQMNTINKRILSDSSTVTTPGLAMK